MIERELYLSKIRPFIGKNIVKVLTGIRRCGKSVMLTLIQKELEESGIDKNMFLSINFESKAFGYVKSLDSTYAHIKDFADSHNGKIFLFLDEVQELEGWEKAINSWSSSAPVLPTMKILSANMWNGWQRSMIK